MRKFLVTCAALMALSTQVVAMGLEGQETYDLLFKNNTLDDVDKTSEIVYRRDVTNALNAESAARSTGDVALSFQHDNANLALLELRQGERYRKLGRFPSSVGNPMIMFFYESVVRDMAQSAGGSPYYIRNRVKESLTQSTEVELGTATIDGQEVSTQTVRLHPFAGDPNVDRMKGFGDLELSVTMSDEVPGWYISLVAEASGGDVYRSSLVFDRVGAAQ